MTLGIVGVISPSAARLQLTSPGDSLGAAVAAGTDLDGDGVVELALGGPSAGVNAGTVWLVPSDLVGAPTLATAATSTLTGAPTSRLGEGLAAGGDFDGDGRPDLVAGAPDDDVAAQNGGAAYVVVAPAVGPVEAAAQLTVRGGQAGMGVGEVLTLADLDGDGFADLLLGIPDADFAGADSGAVYLFYGPGSGAIGTDDYHGLLFGATGGHAGAGVAVGAIDADPSPDLWIAEPGLPGGGAWLVPGP
ncbi:MAG: FG-GAP-like repeat-containing protein [Myxococcota bacterium]